MHTQQPQPLLLGLIGNAGAGKDTVAAFLEDEHAFERIGFADPVLDMVLALFNAAGIDGAWAVERSLKELPTPVLNTSYRRLAQSLGTQWGRELIGPELWVTIAAHRLQQARQHQLAVVISDVRFQNEAAWIRRAGGVLVKVQRQGLQPVAAHVSETELLGITPDYTLDNDFSVAVLFDQVEDLLDNLRQAQVQAPTGDPA